MATKQSPAPRRALMDTSVEQWQAVGWMVANIDRELPAIRRAAAGIELAAFTDDEAALVLQAIREVCERPAASITEIIVECRGIDAGFSSVRLAREADQNATAHRRVLSDCLDRIAEGHAQRLYLDALEDAQASDLGPAARQMAVERLAKVAERAAPARDEETDALTVADQWAQDPDEKLIPTGFQALDQRFGGGLPTGITAISGMPGAGKSAFAGGLILGALEHDRELRAIWFRGEMSNSLLWSRFLATWSAIRYPAVPRITSKEARKRRPAAHKVNADLANIVGGRLHIIDPPLSAERMVAAIRRLRPGLVVIDYLQRCGAPGFPDKRSEIDHVLSVVSDITTRDDLATIIVSSMAGRHQSARGGADIGGMTKESNRLDYDCHNYLALWCDKRDRKSDPRPVRLEIVKARSGGEGELDLWFSGTDQTFTPQASDDQERLAADDFAGHALEPGR